MTQSIKQTINQVFSSVNKVMRMCHEEVAIASMDEQTYTYSTYTYSLGNKHVAVTCYDFEHMASFTIAAADSDYVESLNVYHADYMECAYIYAVICDALGV